jgi:RHS repeat-associated protein
VHNDHRGTPQTLTNQAGAVVWRATYDPFGWATVNEDPDGDGVLVKNNMRDAGQYFDAETGLHYNWNRYYDPKVGRYITSDPIGLKGGLNTYLYANANPLTWIDPDGLKSFRCTKPLNALGGSGTRSGPDIWGNPLYHQYSCIVRDGKVACGGQDHEGSPVYGPGKPSNDSYNPDRCEETQPDNDCFEKCLVNEWAKPRPNYGIPVGTDCQEYDDDVNRRCRKQCKVK